MRLSRFRLVVSRPSWALAALLLAGCGDGLITQPHPGAALTTLPRALSPAEQSVLAAANDFSFTLWHQENAAVGDSNIFVSPLSASFSLGMAMNGAAGQTFEQMRSGLGFGSVPAANVDSGYQHAIALLTSLDRNVTMQIANSIWYRNTFPFNQQFLTEDATYFGATISPLDFDNTPASLAAINGWVSAKTNGRIPSIVSEIDPADVMFLVNAIYFKGSWRERFDPTLTRDTVFRGRRGAEPVRLMHREGTMLYAGTPGYEAVELPYGDSAFTMDVILPAAGASIDSLAGALTPELWHSIVAGLRPAKVALDLPKFTATWQRDMIPDLEVLGMHAPFAPNGADFSRMSPLGSQLYISRVRQKTHVSVDEEGTEAAAVTSTGVTTTAVELSAPMRVDRPFLLVIRERLSGTILFMGKILDVE